MRERGGGGNEAGENEKRGRGTRLRSDLDLEKESRSSSKERDANGRASREYQIHRSGRVLLSGRSGSGSGGSRGIVNVGVGRVRNLHSHRRQVHSRRCVLGGIGLVDPVDEQDSLPTCAGRGLVSRRGEWDPCVGVERTGRDAGQVGHGSLSLWDVYVLVSGGVGHEGKDVGHGRVDVAPTEVLELPVGFDGADGRVVRVVGRVFGALGAAGEGAAEEDGEDTVLVAVRFVLVETGVVTSVRDVSARPGKKRKRKRKMKMYETLTSREQGYGCLTNPAGKKKGQKVSSSPNPFVHSHISHRNVSPLKRVSLRSGVNHQLVQFEKNAAEVSVQQNRANTKAKNTDKARRRERTKRFKFSTSTHPLDLRATTYHDRR